MAVLEEMYNDGAVKGELTVIPGFRFYPTEEELVGFYLKNRVQGGHQLNFDIIIPTLDMYQYDPWELPGLANDVGERQWFFFVPRESKKCARPTRLTVSGYWKATGSDRAIRNELLQCIGLKKTLVFYKGKAPLGKRSEWIMNEYRMPDLTSSLPKKKMDMVVCRIYRKAASQKLMEQRAKPDRFEKENLVALTGNECEEKNFHSINLACSSQSIPMADAKVPPSNYNGNEKGVSYSNVPKMYNEAPQLEDQKGGFFSHVSNTNKEASQSECLRSTRFCKMNIEASSFEFECPGTITFREETMVMNVGNTAPTSTPSFI
eukprot:PITA_26847